MAAGCHRWMQSHLHHARSALPAHCRALGRRVRPSDVVRRPFTAARRGVHSGAVACAAQQPAAGDRETFTITTPLYYVNAAPHMGSAYPTIAADAVARFQRLRGKRVRFLTGTDEHGEKIALAAAKRGLEPRAHCDAVVAEYQSLWARLDISYDAFVRTTAGVHEALVAEVLQRVWDKGDVYSANYEGWYCVDCEEFKDATELAELEGAQHCCPTHRRPCQHREEENYFFSLSRYQDQLEALVAEGSAFVAPPQRRNEVAGWVDEGARDFSISRTGVTWGIPFPRDPSHTVYVWFDALLGYLSGLLLAAGAAPEGAEGASLIERALASGWPADVHVIGKDILRFHAVYWPGMLLSAGLPLPKQVFGHGFLTKDGLKMGKSLGNTLDPGALVDAYGADAVRYYFLRHVEFGSDGNFGEAAFREVVSAALANTIGNMLNRTLNMLHQNCEGVLPLGASDVPANHPVRRAVDEALPAAAEAYERLSFHSAIEAVLAVAVRGNLALEEAAPWTAFKKGTEADKAASRLALVAVLEAARCVAVALSPVTPALSARMYQQLGLGPEALQQALWEDARWGQLRAGHATSAPAPVFARIEKDCAWVTEPPPAPAPKGGKAPKQPKAKKAQTEAAAAV